MSEDRTVLEHLLDGRDALVLEVTRLTSAIEELDSVIARISGGERRLVPSGSGVAPVSVLPAPPAATPGGAVDPIAQRPVNSPANGDPLSSASVLSRARSSATTRRAPARRPASGTSASTTARSARTAAATQAPKSIRVHVLEMLGEQDREYGLAEIIDHVHAAGIQAHDDAVRSITIKLMKDGQVERVGRGQYRLARRNRGASRSSAAEQPTEPAPPAPEAPVFVLPETVDAEPVDSQAGPVQTVDAAEPDAGTAPAGEPAAASGFESDAGNHDVLDPESDPAPVLAGTDLSLDEATTDGDEPPVADPAEHQPESDEQSAGQSYTPPLNLAQPWERP